MKDKLKKSALLIGLGIINLLHGSLHILQFIQSMLLVQAATFGKKIEHEDTNTLDSMLHSPFLAILWALVGLFTLWVGIKDFIHHRKCDH